MPPRTPLRSRARRTARAVLDRPWTAERGGACARTGVTRMAAGRAVRGDRRLLPAADAQRRRGAARGRGRRGSHGVRHGRHGRARGGLLPAWLGLARLRGGVRRRGTAGVVGGPVGAPPPAPRGGSRGDGLHGGGDGRRPRPRARARARARRVGHTGADRGAAALLHGIRAADRCPPRTRRGGGGGGAGADGRAAAGWGDRPELVRACRLTMAIAMLAMLLPL